MQSGRFLFKGGLSMDVEVRVDTGGIDALLAQMTPALQDVLKLAAFNIQATSRQLVPVDTGATKNSIQPDFSQLANLQVSIGPSTHYAPYLEFGTRYMAARPFMT